MAPFIRKVNYYECDAMGVVHHSNYLRYMEEARIDRLARLGYDFASLASEGIVSPVVSLECRYLKPVGISDTLEIDVRVESLTAFKLTLSYVMTSRGTKVFEGSSVHCFLKDGRPLEIASRFPLLANTLTR
ncbi:MAG: acyl-CoA thioesterase [Bacteroidales bacterium]|nr:acyl-CoA thioesterase [Bacteroidales bacterium]